ncbi:MAG: TRCF domain-containing protein, partial [Steroidobacteraceae bacterium]
ESYVSDVHVRLVLYKRIAAAPNGTALDDLTAELVDRFGPLPAPAHSLFGIARLKLRARELGVRRLDLGAQGGYVLFEPQNGIDPAVIVRLIQRDAREFRLDGALKLRVSRPLAQEPKRFEYARELLERLGKNARPVAAPAARRLEAAEE